MYKRDYLVKQFEEFGKVFALILGLKKDKKFDDMDSLIKEATSKYTNTEIITVETLADRELLNKLTLEYKLDDEQLKILADLIFEKGEYYSLKPIQETENAINCYKKANLIYQFIKDNATLSFSLDIHYKIEILQKMNL
jgi:hypothetical protein